MLRAGGSSTTSMTAILRKVEVGARATRPGMIDKLIHLVCFCGWLHQALVVEGAFALLFVHVDALTIVAHCVTIEWIALSIAVRNKSIKFFR